MSRIKKKDKTNGGFSVHKINVCWKHGICNEARIVNIHE